jgi:hypothetical protein
VPGDGENCWYHPEERWPHHPKPWFRDALDYARAHGWFFKKLSSHSFGLVYCRRSEDGDHCKFRVDSTGRGGESKARDLQLLVDRCTHGTAALSNATTIETQVAKAERLTEAAAALIDESRQAERAGELYARAEELLEAAEDRAQEIDQLMSDASEAEREARAAHWDGVIMLAGTEVPPDEGAPAVLDAAERTASSAHRTLRREPNSPSVRNLRQRVRRVRDRIGQLRVQLESNSPADQSFNAE